jgi:hypothetical protein
MCSEVRHRKANDLVQEKIMSLAAKNEHSSHCEVPESHLPSRSPSPKGHLGY